MKRAIIPQAIRPALRQVILHGEQETVLVEGDGDSEHWGRFPESEKRLIRYLVVPALPQELTQKLTIPEPDSDFKPSLAMTPCDVVDDIPEIESEEEILESVEEPDPVEAAQAQRRAAIAKARAGGGYRR